MERIDKVQNLIPEKPEFVHSNQEKGEAIESLKIVNRPVVKKDAAALQEKVFIQMTLHRQTV